MKQAFSVLFFIKKGKQISSEKHRSIHRRITINGSSTEFSTGVKCKISDWDITEHRIKGKSKAAKQSNLSLDSVKARMESIFYKQTLMGDVIAPQMIKEIFTGGDMKKRFIISMFQHHNNQIHKMVGVSKSRATYLKYEMTRKHLQHYIHSSMNKDDYPIHKINYQFICGFELYLRTVGKCAHNTTAKFMQFFKRILLIALNEGYIKENPFSNYKITLKKVNRVCLSMDEVNRIAAKEFTIKRLEIIRDLFIFACYTGISYIDIKNLTPNNLHASLNGDIWIRLNRKKSEEFSNIKLMDIPKAILQKYASDNNSKFLFPVPSNQKVNAYLKEIADLCEVDKQITFHMARHTMATTIALSNGMPIESLARMLGHSNIRTTQLYARITDLKLSDDVDRLNTKLNRL